MQLLLHLSVSLFVFVDVIVVHVNCEPDLMSRMTKVKNQIFKDYDKYIRPTNGTNTTVVNTLFIPRQIIDFDEDKSLFSMDSFLYFNWLDPRLKWDKADYDGELQAPRSMLWVPDISVFNSHSAQVDPTEEVLLAIDHAGWVLWVPPSLTQTSCSSMESPYPGDEVECIVYMGSWMTHGWAVDFQHSHDLYLDEFLNIHPRWELIPEKTHTFRNETFYDCCPEPYISINVVFALRRRPVPEIEATRAPCALVMCLALAIFWLPPDSSKKILLGGFLFVVLNVLLVYVALSTRGPLLVLYAVSFLQTTMYLVAITILLQVFVVIKIASQSGPARPPQAITHILTGPLGKYACLRSPVSEDVSLDRVQLKEDSSTVESFTARDEWKLLAAATDRALFVIMALVMIAVHHL